MEAKQSIGDSEAANHVVRPGHNRHPAMSTSFAGRLGGNQEFTVKRHDNASSEILAIEPDAAPGMTLKQQFNLTPFRTLGLWKSAMIEGFGKTYHHSYCRV